MINEAKMEKAIKLAAKGKHLKQIEDAVDLPYSTISAYFRKHKIKCTKLVKQHNYDKADALAKKGVILPEIIKKTGISRNSLETNFRAKGIKYLTKKVGLLTASRNNYTKAIRLNKQGKSLSDIERATGISYSSIRSYFKINKIEYKTGSSGNTTSIHDYTKADKFANRGFNIADISVITEIDYDTLRKHFIESGIVCRKSSDTDEKIRKYKEAVKLKRSNHSNKEIADIMGWKESTVDNLFRK